MVAPLADEVRVNHGMAGHRMGMRALDTRSERDRDIVRQDLEIVETRGSGSVVGGAGLTMRGTRKAVPSMRVREGSGEELVSGIEIEIVSEIGDIEIEMVMFWGWMDGDILSAVMHND